MEIKCPNCQSAIAPHQKSEIEDCNDPFITVCLNCAAILEITDKIKVVTKAAIAQIAGQDPTRIYNILATQNNVRKSRAIA
jgi:hypothetical protein